MVNRHSIFDVWLKSETISLKINFILKSTIFAYEKKRTSNSYLNAEIDCFLQI